MYKLLRSVYLTPSLSTKEVKMQIKVLEDSKPPSKWLMR